MRDVSVERAYRIECGMEVEGILLHNTVPVEAINARGETDDRNIVMLFLTTTCNHNE